MLIETTLRDTTCEWFAYCENPSTDTRWHPVIGDVPVCDSCALRVDVARGVHREH